MGQVQVDSNAIAPVGGPLTAGIYDLSEWFLYTTPGGQSGPTGETKRETIAISGSEPTWIADLVEISGGSMKRRTGAITRSGTALRFAATCPERLDGGVLGGGDFKANYSISDGTLVLYDLTATGPVTANVYTRR